MGRTERWSVVVDWWERKLVEGNGVKKVCLGQTRKDIFPPEMRKILFYLNFKI